MTGPQARRRDRFFAEELDRVERDTSREAVKARQLHYAEIQAREARPLLKAIRAVLAVIDAQHAPVQCNVYSLPDGPRTEVVCSCRNTSSLPPQLCPVRAELRAAIMDVIMPGHLAELLTDISSDPPHAEGSDPVG